MSRLRTLHSAERVRARIDQIAGELFERYRAHSPVFVVIAEGARRFAHELEQRMVERGISPQMVPLRAVRTSGSELHPVRLEAIDPTLFKEREVLVIDDIADEGRTLEAVLELVVQGGPASVRVAVLVDKSSRRQVRVPLDYVGFVVEDGWVVGMGMDLEERYRELDYLAVVEESA